MQKLSGLFLVAVLISGVFSSSSVFAQIPTIVDDFYSVNEDSLLTVNPDGVLFNDINLVDDFFAIIQTSTGFGTLTLNQNGTFTYQPNQNFDSTDSFTYVATNGTHNSNEATVTLSVDPINDAPVAQDDLAETQQNVLIRIDVLENDSDVEDDSLNIILEVNPSITMGNATLDGSDVLFTPQTNFVGETSFSYRASDGNKTSNLANVTITINPINDTPVALDDFATTPENIPVIIPVLNNDIDNDSLTINSVTQGINGTVTTNGTTIIYSPETNFNGTDHFTYVITDGEKLSNSANVTVTVTAEPNDDTIIDQLLAQIQSLLDKILNLEDKITLLTEENLSLALRNSELEDVIASGTSSNDDNDDDNHDKVIVCHKDKKSISISENALPAHLKHGDVIGECNTGDDSDISFKKSVENQIKELKNDFKIQEKTLKNEFKSQEKELKNQLKDLKDKKHHDDDKKDKDNKKNDKPDDD